MSPRDADILNQELFAGIGIGAAIYENPLAAADDVAGWRLEGQAAITFPRRRMRMESILSAREGQKANYVFWCPQEFAGDALYTWDFYPVQEPGLAMFWFAARGRNGEDIFDARLQPRLGEYEQYHHGDINAYHASYFRRGQPGSFQVCNLRKSYGFHLVAQGADPIPSFVYDAPYRISVLSIGGEVRFGVNGLLIYRFIDDGTTSGQALHGGKIGFRQMAPLIAEYANLAVHQILRR